MELIIMILCYVNDGYFPNIYLFCLSILFNFVNMDSIVVVYDALIYHCYWKLQFAILEYDVMMLLQWIIQPIETCLNLFDVIYLY